MLSIHLECVLCVTRVISIVSVLVLDIADHLGIGAVVRSIVRLDAHPSHV